MKITPLLFLFLTLFISGCASDVEVFHSTNSLGKQLEDLNQAYQSKAISEQEYQQAKEILIDHYK